MKYLRTVTLMILTAFGGMLAAAPTSEATPMAGLLLGAPSLRDIQSPGDLRSSDAPQVEKAYYRRYHRHYYRPYYHRRYYRPYYPRRYHRRYYGYYRPYYYRRWHPFYW